MSRRRGFTIVELVVAFLAGALLLGVLGGLTYYLGRPSRRAQARLAGTMAVQAVESWLSRDLAMARGVPVVADGGDTLTLPVHPEGAVFYRSRAGEGVFRTLRDEPARRIHAAADVGVRFALPSAEGIYRLEIRAEAFSDTRTVERDESRDTRGDVAVTLSLPDFALDERRSYPFWESPAPPGAGGS